MTPSSAELVEYLLGTLAAGERAAIERELEARPELRRRLRQTSDELARDLAIAAPPAGNLRSRVLDTLVPDKRLDGFSRRLASLFEIDLATSRSLLDAVRSAPGAPWRPTGIQGISLLNVRPGEQPAHGLACLVHLEPGSNVPRHRHGDEERMLILEGYATENGSRDVGPGDLIVSASGTDHAFVIESATPCIFAIRTTGDIVWM